MGTTTENISTSIKWWVFVVLPFIIDQPLNGRVLVDKGMSIEVEKNEDGSFTRNDIAKPLRQ
ncbi:putative soyasaponin III rhamnosyltransferase [Lupinus albus]|uniref:Putative soyasaponin III rhamnosyltransferase n=1 Tax=Lupinus albus TaxID=3870 RepID=A0A6A4QSA2_LUPAL|nr:putative soyasaponin III rhamnosyltransferase [Lupinus albus]